MHINPQNIHQKDEPFNQKEKLTIKSKPLNRKNIQKLWFQGYPWWLMATKVLVCYNYKIEGIKRKEEKWNNNIQTYKSKIKVLKMVSRVPVVANGDYEGGGRRRRLA